MQRNSVESEYPFEFIPYGTKLALLDTLTKLKKAT
jgi:hypothetical protein